MFATAARSADLPADMTLVPESGLDSCSESFVAVAPEASREASAPFGFRILSFAGQRRMFGIIPNYRASQFVGDYKPLTTREKFTLARRDSFDWPNFPLLAGYAIQSQVAAGGFRHNGGVKGFAEFYSRSVADQVIGNYITEAILPSLLHEDPRFFRMGQGPIHRRASHAFTNILITRTTDGRARFNISEVVGNAGVAAIGRTYYREGSFVAEAGEHWGMSLGNDVISNLLTEFWPDIKRKQTRR